MAITLVPGSASMTIAQRPAVNLPTASGITMAFTCNNLVAGGRCRLNGSAGDNPMGWTLGLVQLQWIETNWGYYRGQTSGTAAVCYSAHAHLRGPSRAAATRWLSVASSLTTIPFPAGIGPWLRRGMPCHLL